MEKNGYVTYLELTNCFKSHFEKELFGKSLAKIFRPFCSIQNKILINYNQLIDHLKKRIEAVKAKEAINNFETMSTHSSINKLKPLSPNLLSRKNLLADGRAEPDILSEKSSKLAEILTPRVRT